MIVNVNGCGNIVTKEKKFSTGSTGEYGSGKIIGPDGSRYQVNIQIVKIRSKPTA